MAADGRILIDTRINTKGIRAGEAEIMSASGRIAGSLKKLALVVGAAFSIKKIVDFGKEAVRLGSDLEEVQNVVDVTFTEMSDKVNDFAKNAAMSAGLSETMAKRYVGTFGAMSKSFGFSENAAYNMSTALTQLSGDVASFYNISQDEVYTKLKSVFTGETESLKELGIVMTQTALDSYAMANGIGKTTSAMTEQEKVALRYRFIVDQLSGASGDFIRTSDSWANRVRIMQLQISSLKATIGQGLINVFNPILNIINIVLARLATVANAFKAFTELITGGKSGGNGNTGIVDEMSDTAASYDAAADSASEYANAAGAAGGAAKKAGKEAEGALASFDKLNVQQDQSGSSGGGGGGGAGVQAQNVDYGTIAEGETDKAESALDRLMAKIRELKGLFMGGFFDGVGDLSVLDSIRESVQSIWDSLSDIFTDEKVVEAANKMVNTLAYNLGRMVGAYTSIGLTIADNIYGGFSQYLEENKDRIADYLASMFDITGSISTIVANFMVAAAEIFSAFRSEAGKQLTADIISIFADSFMGVTELAGKFARDILDTILTPFTENKDKFKTALEGLLSAIEPVVGTIADSVKKAFDEINDMYDEHIKPLFDSIRDGLSEILGKFLDGYNNYMVPTLTKLSNKFTQVWKEKIEPLISNAIGLIGDISDLVKALWENVFQPFLSWFAENVYPVISPAIEGIGSLFIDIFGEIGGIIDTFISNLRALIQFLTQGFSGDWEGAWNGLKYKFEEFWNSLPGVVDESVRKIKDSVNEMATKVKESLKTMAESGMSGATGKVVSKIMGRTVAVPAADAPVKLPHLASGTVVPPRAGEFAAILGDNRRETEVVSPLSTMRQAMLEAMQQAGGISGGDINLTVNLDGRVVYQNVIKRNRQEKIRTGLNPLMV